MYNIEAYHHYSPPLTTTMFKLIYSSGLLVKDLEDMAEARKKANLAIEQRNAQILAQNQRNAARARTQSRRNR